MSEEFFTKVAGVTRQNADGSLRQDIIEDLEEEWQAGEAVKLTLRREPDNAYDRNAVAVLDAEGRQVGYLSRPVASSVAPRMDRGEAVAAELQAVTGGSLTHNYGVNIKIVVGVQRRPQPQSPRSSRPRTRAARRARCRQTSSWPRPGERDCTRWPSPSPTGWTTTASFGSSTSF